MNFKTQSIFCEISFPSQSGDGEPHRGLPEPLPRRWWDTPAPCTGRWCWGGRAWTPGLAPGPPPAGSSETSPPPGSLCSPHGGCSQLTALYRWESHTVSNHMFLRGQHENPCCGKYRTGAKSHTLSPDPLLLPWIWKPWMGGLWLPGKHVEESLYDLLSERHAHLYSKAPKQSEEEA